MHYITVCIVSLLLHLGQTFQIRGVKINVTDTRVRATSVYTFFLDRTVNDNSNITPWDQFFISSTDNFTITFPIQYIVSSSYNCASVNVNGFNSVGYLCLKSGNQIIVRNFISTNTYVKTIVLAISGVVNPSPGGPTNNFLCSIGSDVCVPDYFSSLILTANSFASCSAAFNNVFGNSTGQLRISTSSYLILSNSAFLTITFPYFWARDVSRQLINFPVSTNCSSMLGGNIMCSGGVNASGNPMVTINNIFFDGGSHNSQFSLFQVLSPITNQPIDKILINSYQSTTDQPVDTCTVYVSGIIPRTISTINVIPLQPAYPSSAIPISLQFYLPDSLQSSDTIFIDFSSSYSPSFDYLSISGSYFANLISESDNQINFTFNRVHPLGSPLNITVYYVITAPSIAPTTPFYISVQLYGYQKMIGYFTMPTVIGSLSNVSLNVEYPSAGASSKYTLSFILNPGYLGVQSVVRVYFPQYFIIPLNVKVFCQGFQIASKLINNTKALQITNFTIPPLNPITLTFRNLTNLQTTSPTSFPLLIKTYLSSSLMDEIAESSTTISIKLNPTSTIQASVASSSNITYQQPISLTFSVTNQIPLRINSTVHIFYFQIDTKALNSSQNNVYTNIQCWINGIFQNCFDVSYGINQRKLVIDVNITDNGSGLEIVVDGWFINTRVTKPISYFVVQTYTRQGYKLQYQLIPSYLTDVIQPRTLDYFILYSRTSTVNSALSTYTFVLSQAQPLLSNYINTVVVTFPPQIGLGSASCQYCTINVASSTITFSISSKFMQLVINDIVNSYNTEPINSITASVQMNSIFTYSKSQYLDNYIMNTQPSALNISTVSYSSQIYGTLTNVTFSIYGVKGQPAYFAFVFPRQYNMANLAWNVIGAAISEVTIINTRISIYLTNYTNNNIRFSLLNVGLPIINQSLPIAVTSYTINNYSIASGLLASWAPNCTLPCETCTSISTECLSCFNNFAIVSQNLYDPILKKCVDQCTQFQIQINLTCIKCASQCLTCSVIITNCTSCGTGLYLYQNQCIKNCPPTFYKFVAGRTCQLCNSPCSTCVNSIQCLTCLNGWYFYNQSCILSCPIDSTVPDQINNTCINCAPECFTCRTSYNNCTSCSSNLAMQNGSCVSQCSNSLYIYNSLCVASCKQGCQTCSVYANYCLTCPSNLYLYLHTCALQCPSMYYISADFSCQPCASLSINCKYCSSPQICLICDSGYVLFEQQCLNYTPSGYTNISGVATICDDSCVTCDNLVTNCTSCRYLFYYNGNCIASCPVTHYQVNNTCQRCVSPCNTCLNLTTCLTCLGNIGVYYIAESMSCSTTCPNYYYANSSLAKCLACQPPCATCQSLTVCTSCINSTFLYNSRCILLCPPGYFPNTTINTCTLCTSPCLTCTTSLPTSCINCIQGYYYLYPNSCVPACPSNYITNYIYKLCENCTAPCLVCSQTACFKCNSAFILYQNRCITSCPSTHYPETQLDVTRQCARCSIQCQSCLNSTFCTSCSIGYFWQNTAASGICVAMCPIDRPILTPDGCQPCRQQNCTSCYLNNQCYQCANTSILFEGFCYNECPSLYQYNSSINSCSLIPPIIPQPQNQTNITVQPVVNLSVTIKLPIDMVFTYAGAGLTIILFVLAYCANIKPYLILVCAWALSEVGSVFIAGYAYHKFYVSIFTVEKLYGFVMVSAAALFILLNLFVFGYLTCRVLAKDQIFRRWKKSASCLQIFYLSFCLTLSLVNFKFHHLIWCGSKSTPKLASVSKLKYLSVSSAISLISSVSIVVVLVLLINQLKDLLLIWVDTIVVVIVSAILSVIALRRDNKFFEELIKGDDGDVVLHRRHISSDQFLTKPMKGTQKQQFFQSIPQNKKLQLQSSQYEIISQSSSRFQLKSSSRSFLSYRNQSFQQSLQSQRQSKIQSKIQSQIQSEPKAQTHRAKNQLSIQCSILSSGNHMTSEAQSETSSAKKYYIECEYEPNNENSKNAIMGSIEQSKQWDGIAQPVQYYKQKYDLNKAIILDQRGMKMQLWDVESNQAVLQEAISYNNNNVNQSNILGQIDALNQQKQKQAQNQINVSRNIINTENNTITHVENKSNVVVQQKQQIEQKTLKNQSVVLVEQSDISIIPISINQMTKVSNFLTQQNNRKQQKQFQPQIRAQVQHSQKIHNTSKNQIQDKHQQYQKQQKSIIINFTQLLRQRLQIKQQQNSNQNIGTEQSNVNQISKINSVNNNRSLINKSYQNNNEVNESIHNSFKASNIKNKSLITSNNIYTRKNNYLSNQSNNKISKINQEQAFQNNQKQEQVQKIENQQDIQDGDIDIGDRFDNSVLTNHHGELQTSYHDYVASQISNHRGSLQSQPSSEQNDEEQSGQSSQGKSEQLQAQIFNQDENDQNNIVNQQQRWEFLLQKSLHNQSIDMINQSVHSKVKLRNSTININSDNHQQGQFEGQNENDREDILINKSQNQEQAQQQFVQNQENTRSIRSSKKLSRVGQEEKYLDSSQINQNTSGQKSIKSMKMKQSSELAKSNISKKSKKSSNVPQKYQQRLATSKKFKFQQGHTIQSKVQQESNDDQYSNSGEDKSQYLKSKIKLRDSKPDDHNKFAIKTKRRKKNDPKHKVVVVDNKKFTKLKRQASQLQKQIQQGQKLKNLIAYQQSKLLSRSKSRQTLRNQQLIAIYMKQSRQFPN